MLLEVIKYTGVMAVFAGVGVTLFEVLKDKTERNTVRMGLDKALYSAEGLIQKRRAGQRALPFAQRVLGPSIKQLSGLVYRFGPKGMEDQNRKRVHLAGLADKIDPDTFFSISVVAPFLTLGALWLFGRSAGSIPGLFWVFVPTSALLPKMWLTRRVEDRQHAMALALPDTLDLLTIAVEAGLGFDAAMSRVVNAIQGPLSDELYRMLQELKIGVPRNQALKNLSARTEVESLDQFITAINQADAFGISIGRVLKVQSRQLRLKRSQIAQEKAAKTPVKILFPLMACIFPALFTVLVGPAAISIAGNLSGF